MIMLGDSATYMRFILLLLMTLAMAFGADSAAIVKKVGHAVRQWHLEAGKARQAITVERHVAMPGNAN